MSISRRTLPIKVVIAEDQELVLGALSALIDLEDDFEVVGLATDGNSALNLVEREQPDILLTDIEMPGLGGIELASKVSSQYKNTRIVIITAFARPGYLRRAQDAGARGYILKDSPPDLLISTLKRVNRGGKSIDPALAVDAWGESDPLTERERQVLALAESGLPSKLIARKLSIAPGTVRNHISEAIAKLGVSNRIEAVNVARQRGLL